MYRFRNALITLVGMLSLVTIATVTLPHLSYGSSGPTAAAPSSQPQNVNVVNTPTVNAQQIGTWNVGINGTPVVKIDNASPVVTRDTENPARQRIVASNGAFLQDGQWVADSPIFTVPAGKTLVVEYVSVEARLSNQRLITARIGARDNLDIFRTHFLPVTAQGADVFGNEVFTLGQSLRLYFQQNADVFVVAERNSTAGNTSVYFAISGYLVDN